LQSLFRERLAKILQMPASQLNSHQPLTEIGVDSLMAMELRTSILTNLGVAVPLVKILQGPSLAELVRIVDEQITLQKPDEDPGAYTEAILEHFSDQDVDVMLESMLHQDEGARNIE
jgi:aryl carrier-like protein